MKKPYLPLVAFLSLLLVSSAAFAVSKSREAQTVFTNREMLKGTITGVSTGMVMNFKSKKGVMKVRLFGIDTSWYAPNFRKQARKSLEALVTGKRVEVTIKGEDQFGWSLGVVKLPNDKIVNHELLKKGLVWWSREQAPTDQALSKLEAEARNAKRGLWGQQDFVSEACVRRKQICASKKHPVACIFQDPTSSRMRTLSGPNQCQVVEDIRFEFCMQNRTADDPGIQCVAAVQKKK